MFRDIRWLTQDHIANGSWNQYLSSKTNGLCTISHRLVLCSFFKRNWGLTHLVGIVPIMQNKEIRIKENRDLISKFKEIGTL